MSRLGSIFATAPAITDEEHVISPQEIAAAYDQLAVRWVAPDFDQTNGIEAHQRALSWVEGAASAAALDVGCGSNPRIARLLAARGYRVDGVDLSAGMLALARQANVHADLYEADICSWQPPHQYAFISAWDSIWHVPLMAQAAVLQKLCAALQPDGIFIFTFGGLSSAAAHTDASMGVPLYYSTLGVARTLAVVHRSGCVCRHLEYDQSGQPHAVLVVQRIDAGVARPEAHHAEC